jgi:methanogenic corrinoid protein MtbC1
LKSRGFNTIYLGDNVPLEDLRHIVEEKKPAQIFMHLINTGKPFRLDRFIQQLSGKIPSTDIIVSGKPSHPPKTWPSNARVINEVQELFN